MQILKAYFVHLFTENPCENIHTYYIFVAHAE